MRKALRGLGRDVADLPPEAAEAEDCVGCRRPFLPEDRWPGVTVDGTPVHLGYGCILRGPPLQGTDEPDGDASEAWWSGEVEARRRLEAALAALGVH